MGGCDKTTPALVMGAVSAGFPMIYLPAGPMLRGNYKGEYLGSGSDAWKYWDERRAGTITDEQWTGVEDGIARSYGHCMTIGTASTMTAIAEALGLTLPGASSIPAADANHIRMSTRCGRRIVEMVFEDLTPDKIVTRQVRRQCRHRRHGDRLLDQCRRASDRDGAPRRHSAHARRSRQAGRTTPVIANIRPSGKKYLMEDFYYAGGLRALMAQMKDRLHLDAMTVTGVTLGETLEGAEVYNDDVIRPLSNPIYHEGSLAVLKGNLAPDGCVIKPSACEERFRVHEGPALVFDSYPGDEGGNRRRRSRRHRRPCPGAAQCRPEGRPGHAGMGHAADAEEAPEAGPSRHAAPFRCAHERHQLRRLHPACRAGIACRRPAGAAAAPATSSASTCPTARSTCWSTRRALADGVPPGWRPPTSSNAAMAGCSLSTSPRPHEGCDFDFLENGFGATAGEPDIF